MSIIVLNLPSYGAEIDSYKNMYSIKDATSVVDKRVNEWLSLAIDDLNQESIECPANAHEAGDVYDIVQSKMASPFIGHTIAVELDEALPQDKISRTDFDYSIYAGINWIEGVSLNLKGLLGVMNIGRRRVGVDKIGHFFVEGYGFYKRAYLKKHGTIGEAVKWGKFTENTYFGITTTGIYSNADLIANFNGMRFWNMLFLFSQDPTFRKVKRKYSKVPFFSCQKATWSLNKKFTIRHFLDDSWDESLNCNDYDTKSIKDEVVLKEAFSLGVYTVEKNGGLVCPRMQRDCSYEKSKYGRYAQELLHKSCFDKSEQYRIDPSILKLRLYSPYDYLQDNDLDQLP